MLKFIGQHIVDLIARFRSDVFLEDVSSGTIASGGNLGLDSNNKIVKANVPTSHDAVTLTGTPDYITISGQEITRNQIDLANDVTGTLAAGNVATLNQDTTGSAATLTTPRGFRTNLASTSGVNFDGSSDVAPGVDGVLPVANGGTGLTSLSTLLNSNVDHDALTNFVAEEHYRWDTDISGTATIHANNITDLHGAGVDGSANQLLTDDGDGTVTSEANLTFDSGSLQMQNSAISLLTLKRTSTGSDNDTVGVIRFTGNDDADNALRYASINAKIIDASNGAEEGQLNLVVASHDGEEVTGLSLTSGDAEDEIDVSIASGTSSATTIAGDLTVTSDATISGGNLTVTSGTSGDATLIISADTDNNNEDDNSRLWFKQDGDITEGAIQMSNNVLNIINNISATGGISFQTGTTNNTGTTDPSTGATERMSIASGGTVTVAGALQPNTIELGHASDTTLARSAAGKVTIEGANVQTTQICCTHHNMSLDGSSSTTDYYFPINSLADGSSSSLYYTRVLPAYDGKIVKMLFRPSEVMGSSCTIYMSRRAHDGTSTSHQTSGFQASETFDGAAKTTVVVPCGVGGANAADWVFEEGDQLGFSLVKNTTATNVDLTVTIVYEYTV